MHYEHVNCEHYAGDRRRVLHEAELEIVVEYLVAKFGRSANAQRVTVRRSPDDRFEPDVAAGSRPVLDDERATELLGEPLGNQARVDVVRAAGRKTDNEAHRPGRIGLRPREARGRLQRGSARGETEKLPTGKFHGARPAGRAQ